MRNKDGDNIFVTVIIDVKGQFSITSVRIIKGAIIFDWSNIVISFCVKTIN